MPADTVEVVVKLTGLGAVQAGMRQFRAAINGPLEAAATRLRTFALGLGSTLLAGFSVHRIGAELYRALGAMDRADEVAQKLGLAAYELTALGFAATLADSSAEKLENALTNLAVNASDAMPNGGRLTIGTSVSELTDEDALQHPTMSKGRYAVLTVSDTGQGMDEATKAQIFQPFFTTKPVGKGTGLGLPMVYGTVKQMGGFIWVYSSIKGTQFSAYMNAVKTGLGM